MVTIYQAEWCPHCKHVRDWVSENLNGVSIVFVSMPREHSGRKELKKVSGQTGIPTLVDGKTIIPDDDDKIIEYLKKKYRA